MQGLRAIAGTVVSQTVLEGQTLNTNQTAPTLLRIADLDTMTVTAQVARPISAPAHRHAAYFARSVSQAALDRHGAAIVADAGHPQRGRALQGADRCRECDGALLPDMTAQVFFTVDEALDTVTVPINAISNARGGDEAAFVQVSASAVSRSGATCRWACAIAIAPRYCPGSMRVSG